MRICEAAGVKPTTKVKDLTDAEVDAHPLAGRQVRGRGRPAPRSVHEHQAPDGSRLLARHPPSQGLAGARPAHPHQCPHPQGTAQAGGQDERAAGQGLRRDGLNSCLERATRRRTGMQARRQTADRRSGRGSRGGGAEEAARRRARTCSMRSRTCTPRSTTPSSPSPTGRATRCPGRPRAAAASAARARSTPFAAQVAAEKAGTAAQEHGVKNVEVRVDGPGPGTRVGGARAERLRSEDHQHLGRDADPAQRLPSAEEAPRLSEVDERPDLWHVIPVRSASSPAAREPTCS